MEQHSVENFTHVTVDKLNLDCVQNLVPKGYKNLRVSDAKEGTQPPDTYILGSVLEVQKKIEIKNIQKRRVILREVLADGTNGVKVNIILCKNKNFDSELDHVLKSSKTSQGQWLIICNADLRLYIGADPEEYSRLRVRVSYSASRVWLLTERSGVVNTDQVDQRVAGTSIPTASKMNYTLLNDVKVNKKHNVFVVVSELVKGPGVTRNGNLYMLIGIADPSSQYEEDCIKDMLLHIFGKDVEGARNFLESINVGHVLRIRDLMTEVYKDRITAKIYSYRQLILFPGGVDDEIELKSIVSNYTPSDEDINMVKSLRLWCAEHRKNFQIKKKGLDTIVDASAPTNSTMKNPIQINIQIKHINTQMVFTLFCEIVHKRSVSTPNEVFHILQVRDGTTTSLYFKKYNIEEATDDSLTQTEKFTQPGSEFVDIFVAGKVSVPKDVEEGDIVCLKGVLCQTIETVEEENIFLYELKIQENAIIIKPAEQHSEVRRVKTMIENAHESHLSESTQNSLCEEVAMTLRMLEHTKQLRSPKSKFLRSPNRINTQPVRSSASPSKQGVLSPSSRLSLLNIHAQSSFPRAGSSRLSSPKLPSQTDSLERALRDISDLSGRKLREGDHSSSSPLHGQCNPSNARRRLISGNSVENLDVGKIEFPPDLQTSTQIPKSPVQSEGSFCHPSTQGFNMGKPTQTTPSTATADKRNEVVYESLAQKEATPSKDCLGENSELDPMELTPLSHDVNCIGVEEKIAARGIPASSEILSENIIQCSGMTDSTRMSTNEDSEDANFISTFDSHHSGANHKEQNSLKRKIETFARSGEAPSKKCDNDIQQQSTSSKGFRKTDSMERLKQSIMPKVAGTCTNCIVNNKEILTTECCQEGIYTSIKVLLTEGKEQILYVVPGIVKQIFTSSDHHCDNRECLDGDMCYHNWVWGLCEGCGNSFSSEELRKKYPAEDFTKSRLPCIECLQERSSSEDINSDSLPELTVQKRKLRSSAASESNPSKHSKLTVSNLRRSKSENSKASKSKPSSSVKATTSKEDPQKVDCNILPFMHLALRVSYPGDDSEILLFLGGDNATQFFGIEPTFKWLTEKPDDTLTQLVPLLLQQKTPLWFGVLKMVNSTNVSKYLLAHTTLKCGTVHRNHNKP